MKKGSQAKQIWRERIVRAQSFDGTAAEFCKQEGIDPSSFYQWRKHFKEDSPIVGALLPAFAKVAIEHETSSRRELPEARWVGEVLAHMFRSL